MLRFPSALCPVLLSQLDCDFPSREPFRTRSALAQTDKDTALIACRCSRAVEKTRWGEGLGICHKKRHKVPLLQDVSQACWAIFWIMSRSVQLQGGTWCAVVCHPVVRHWWLQPGIWNLEMLSSSSGGQVSCSRIDGTTWFAPFTMIHVNVNAGL